MNTHADTRRRGLHLVTAASTPEPQDSQPEDPQPDDKMAQRIAEGVLKLQTLEDEFDAEALSAHPDLEHVGQLLMEMNVVRQRLRAHGVRVRE